MKNNERKWFITGAVFLLLFAVWTALVMVVDVRNIGDPESRVGMATLNDAFFKRFSAVNEPLYKMTEILGYLSLGIVGAFGLWGLCQLIKRKSLLKVDRVILALGVFYVLVLALYFFFDKVSINLRPLISPGETALEASYPSSHTLLVLAVFGTLPSVAGWYSLSGKAKRFVFMGALFVSAVMVAGRLFSGVHWLTDIAGGVLLGLALIFIFRGVTGFLEKTTASESLEAGERPRGGK